MELRGCRLPEPTADSGPMPESLLAVKGYKNLSTYFPGLNDLLQLTEKPSGEIWLGTYPTIQAIDCSGPGPCNIRFGGEERRVYMKVTHCLDPVRWIQGEYGIPGKPIKSRVEKRSAKKLADPWNQAYIDAVACYVFGRLRKEEASPHFNNFYGAFKAVADTYSYNLTDDFESFRNHRWFWSSKKKGHYNISVVNEKVPSEPVPEKVLEDILLERDLSGYDSESESEESGSERSGSERSGSERSGSERSGSESETGSEAESDSGSEQSGSESESESESQSSSNTENIDTVRIDTLSDTESIHTDNMSRLSFASESQIDENEYRILCNINKFPVMMILTEENNGTMDSLLEDYDAVGAKPDTYEWELRWSAWIFQVIAGLSVGQELLGFTHNDLHTNNVVWSATEEEYLYYTRRDGAHFRVPTFGKIFRIIDFGRAIFRFNGRLFVSDDFRADNDAGGQYRFVPLNRRVRNPVEPNASFDLCRLAVSLFAPLFPGPVEDQDGGITLSSEEDYIVREKVSPLYNALWSWMIDDNGENVYINPDGSERYPDFYLYKHIAAHVHTAVPKEQFVQPAFDRFQVRPSEVGDVKKWSLFC